MDDQIRFEQRRFENLKSAIIREESEETQLFQPSISKTSAAIMEHRTTDELAVERAHKKARKEQDYLREKAKEVSHVP